MASARERLRLEPLLASDPAARRRNHLSLLQALDQVPRFAVEDAWNGADPTTRSWLQLSLMVKGYPSNAEELDANVELWRLQHPQNPLEADVLARFLAELKQRHLPPARVALILPGTGPFAKAAATLRDGFLSAYFADRPDLRPKVTVLLRGETDDVAELYARAVREGAEVVVGPLDKEAVTRLGASESLPIPVLALNRSESLESPPENFYQFGLPPEEEALQVAERARGAGYQRALVLVPKGAWGARLAGAFATHWNALGGTVLEQKTYAPKENDHSDPIIELLNLDESVERRRALRVVVGEPIEFEPRRRRDAEFVFLGAFPRQARSLRPQLLFHHAGGLPLYATSHVFSGRPDPERDADMNGLEFCDMPWLLETSTTETDLSAETFEQSWPAERMRFIRLYALGMDAYGLLAHLTRLRDDPQNMYAGHTGELRMDGRGHLRRELPWASFFQGRPRLLGYPAQEAPKGDATDIPPPGTQQPQQPRIPTAITG
jgi:outer membrane PBP1 activator LpoA protein